MARLVRMGFIAAIHPVHQARLSKGILNQVLGDGAFL
jgi:hypothetical protein